MLISRCNSWSCTTKFCTDFSCYKVCLHKIGRRLNFFYEVNLPKSASISINPLQLGMRVSAAPLSCIVIPLVWCCRPSYFVIWRKNKTAHEDWCQLGVMPGAYSSKWTLPTPVSLMSLKHPWNFIDPSWWIQFSWEIIFWTGCHLYSCPILAGTVGEKSSLGNQIYRTCHSCPIAFHNTSFNMWSLFSFTAAPSDYDQCEFSL